MAKTDTRPRERHRTHARAEVKARAWEQLAAAIAASREVVAVSEEAFRRLRDVRDLAAVGTLAELRLTVRKELG
ncbi:hypothetical protein ACWC0A_22920 [Streptomyces scopuliridis]